jgi:hypothetical protein
MQPHCSQYTPFNLITKTLMRPAMRFISQCVSLAYKSSKRNAESIALRFDGRAGGTALARSSTHTNPSHACRDAGTETYSKREKDLRRQLLVASTTVRQCDAVQCGVWSRKGHPVFHAPQQYRTSPMRLRL